MVFVSDISFYIYHDITSSSPMLGTRINMTTNDLQACQHARCIIVLKIRIGNMLH
jgi:hypothetical protein